MGDPRSHPFVRLGKWVYGGASDFSQRRKAKKAAKNAAADLLKPKKKKTWLGGSSVESSDSEEEDTHPDSLTITQEPSNVFTSTQSRTHETELEDEHDHDNFSFRPGRAAPTEELDPHPFMVQEPIERIGPESIRTVAEAIKARYPNYKDTRTMIPQEKLENAVQERLKRLRPAIHLNGLLSFGESGFTPANMGYITVPDVICVTGHNGYGGNIDVNGIYRRYPDNYNGRPVYQKYIERDEWEPEEQEVEHFIERRELTLRTTATLESGGRTFPIIHDDSETRRALTDSLMSCKVLPAKRAHGCIGDFRLVHRMERWFIFFDDLSGSWCIGPRPVLDPTRRDLTSRDEILNPGRPNLAFARCRAVEAAVPDGLGPEAWEIFDVGRRMWIKSDHLQTRKGGERKMLPDW